MKKSVLSLESRSWLSRYKYLIIMKIIVALMLSCLMCLQAETIAQTVSLSKKDADIVDVFREIKKQTGYNVLCSSSILKQVQTVDVDLKSVPLELALSLILDPKGLTYRVDNKNIVVIRKPRANNKSVNEASSEDIQQNIANGTVMDTEGEFLSGVSVAVKGKTVATATDEKGNFEIPASEGDILLFTSVGYVAKEVSVTSSAQLSVVLEVAESDLDEVVVVGYGVQKKVHLTGAVSQISGERLENRSVTTIGHALQGTVSNLNITSSGGGAPGQNPSINVRGYTGFSSNGSTVSQAPLFVVDGIPGVDINTINVNDVESVSVLKDAASAAIYGSSAPYGAIIVTTKQGKVNQKPAITYNNNLMMSEPINLPTYMRSIDFANLYNEAASNAGVTPVFSDDVLQRIQDYLDGKITTETVANPAPGTDAWLEWAGGNANNDWFDIMYRDFQFNQQHNLGVSGGSANTSYFVGLGYVKQNGMYDHTTDFYDRYNVRANLSTQITPWMRFNLRTALSRATDESPTGDNWMRMMAARNWPTQPLYVPNGSFASESRMAAFTEGTRTNTTTDKGIITGELSVNPLPGWNITGNYTFDGSYYNQQRHTKTVNITRPSGASQVLYGPNGIERRSNRDQHYIVNLFTSYENEWNGHSFRGLVGYTQELYDNHQLHGRNNLLYSNDIPSLNLTYGVSPTLGDGGSQLAIRGSFGRINYSYLDKYLIEFNGRYDGTSRFLRDSRFKFYPGISAAWVPSQESFWKPIASLVNTFKLRMSYGQLGNQNFTSNNYPFYPSLANVTPSNSNFLFSGGREAYIGPPNLVDPSLTWVTVSTFDIGADLSMFSNRLDLSFDWYKRTSDDYIGPSEALPSLLGTSAPEINNTAMVTKGIDFTISWKSEIGKVRYGVDAVFSDYQSEVLRYPNPSGLNTSWYEGRKFGDIWGYETVGFFTSNDEISLAPSQNQIYNRWSPGDIRYADLNGDGVVNWGENTLENPGDRRVIANNTPRYSFGLNLTADYKNFDMSIFLQGVGKRDAVFSNADAWDGAYFWGITGDRYTGMLTTEQYDRWTPDNPNGYYPKFYLSSEMKKNSQPQTRYVQDASYLRIKNVQFGYSLSKQSLKFIDAQKLRFFVNIENLATFTKLLKTMDPEFATTDGRLYPLQRTWACGINLTF